MKLFVPSSENIINANKLICEEGKNLCHCLDKGKIESAIHSAFYPGAYPFAAGGTAHIAGALCFYLIKTHAFIDGNKRTAALSSIVFLNNNGWDLKYPSNNSGKKTALAEIVEKCAEGKVRKEELITWFDNHKIKLKK